MNNYRFNGYKTQRLILNSKVTALLVNWSMYGPILSLVLILEFPFFQIQNHTKNEGNTHLIEG